MTSPNQKLQDRKECPEIFSLYHHDELLFRRNMYSSIRVLKSIESCQEQNINKQKNYLITVYQRCCVEKVIVIGHYN